jgi:hypothetical protein
VSEEREGAQYRISDALSIVQLVRDKCLHSSFILSSPFNQSQSSERGVAISVTSFTERELRFGFGQSSPFS